MKGNTPRGHGGCCGKYQQGNIIQSGVTSLEDPTVVKKSTLNTRGLIDTKYRWIRRPQPFMRVKAVTRINSQSEYLYYLTQNTLQEKKPNGTNCDDNEGAIPEYKKCTALDRTQITDRCPASKTTKPLSGAITSGDYLYKLHKKCVFPEDLKIYSSIRRTFFTCSNGSAV